MFVMGVWRIRGKNGVRAEKKPVELGSQVPRQKVERLKEGYVSLCVCEETGRAGEETGREKRTEWEDVENQM